MQKKIKKKVTEISEIIWGVDTRGLLKVRDALLTFRLDPRIN